MSTSADKPFYVQQNRGIGSCVPEDDFLHPKDNEGLGQASLTETQYFGVSIPEHRIQGFFYFHHHPNLRTVSGGVWVWQGFKPLPLACEIADWRIYMSEDCVLDNLRAFTLENGYSVTVVDPLERHRLRYADDARSNRVELEYEALAKPVRWLQGKHFDQAMRVRGEPPAAEIILNQRHAHANQQTDSRPAITEKRKTPSIIQRGAKNRLQKIIGHACPPESRQFHHPTIRRF